MYGTVTGLTWEEFIRRAKNYTPTKSFINHQEEIGSPLSQKLKSGKTDLLQWFRDSIESGLREKHIDIRDIHVITLAGGSSQWAFVGEYCQDILKNDQFFKSVMPYAAIANGIAVLPVLEQEFKQKREELIRELPGVFKYLRNKVEESLNKNNTQIISKILEELFDKRILLHLCAFRQEGGKLCDLEQTVISEIEKFKPFANQIIQNETAGNLQPLFGMAVAHIREWLLKHNLRLNKNYRNTSSGSQQVDLPVLDVGESIGNIAAIAGGLTAMIVASTGLGLLSIPAVGWIGVIVLAVVTFFGGLYTAEAVRRISLPTTVTKLVLTDKQINKCREQAEEQLQLELNKTVKLASDTLMGDIEKLVNAEISRLNFTNIIR
jgi:hypothetical protein